jgi:hypothetical protein
MASDLQGFEAFFMAVTALVSRTLSPARGDASIVKP